ncbi:hypothetical protein IL306_011271 [Fusarium sp. DS 682]|nr:hypothetical protein IL306_011271 [Fusarium sp. DS 682]
MCYKIFTHTMRCDARPVISDGSSLFTNPFAGPLPCTCGPEHHVRSYLRCDDHGCCMRRIYMDWCPNIAECNEIFEVHRYIQSHRKPRNVWGPKNMVGGKFSSFWNMPTVHKKQKAWDYVPDFESCLFANKMPHLTTITPPFRMAIKNLVSVGHLIIETQAYLSALEHDIDVRRAMHNAFHGTICESVLNTHECAALPPIATGEWLLQKMRKNFVDQKKIFNACWTFIQSMMWARKVDDSLMLKELAVTWDN